MCFQYLYIKKYKIEPPQITKTVNSMELMPLIKSQLKSGAGSVYMADYKYKLAPKSEYVRMIKHDKTDLMPYIADYFDCPVPNDIAYSLGLFFADGTAGFRADTSGYNGAWWKITNTNTTYLEKAKRGFESFPEDVYFEIQSFASEKKGKITNYGKRNKSLYNLIVKTNKQGKRGKFIAAMASWFYDSNGNKKVPPCIYDSTPEAKKEFLLGVIDGDGHEFNDHIGIITVKGKIGMLTLKNMLEDVNWKHTIMLDKRKKDIYSIYYNKDKEDITNREHACDDSAVSLKGAFTIPKWSALPFGMLSVSYKTITGKIISHRVNIFIDDEYLVWIVESQSDQVFLPDDKDWEYHYADF